MVTISPDPVFAFEMSIGSEARVVSPKEYAAMGMVIRRATAERWERVDEGNDGTWYWTSPGTGLLVVPVAAHTRRCPYCLGAGISPTVTMGQKQRPCGHCDGTGEVKLDRPTPVHPNAPPYGRDC